eukprot:306494-Prymnesium_polylepis.1
MFTLHLLGYGYGVRVDRAAAQFPLRWRSVRSLPRIGSRLLTAKRARRRGSAKGQQGRQRADSAHSSRQRSERHSGWWAEAAHLFRPHLSHTSRRKMLSSGRHRAGWRRTVVQDTLNLIP